MRYSTSLVTLIETAEAATPFCACGKGMVPVEHDGELWLECVEHDTVERGILGRIRSLFGHDRRLLLAREELAA
jgi:hypothetical protein